MSRGRSILDGPSGMLGKVGQSLGRRETQPEGHGLKMEKVQIRVGVAEQQRTGEAAPGMQPQ